VPVASRVAQLLLAYFSRPASDRPLYRAIRRHRFVSIVEIGLGSAQRALRLIKAARSSDPAVKVLYTGIDLFELRSPTAGERLSLKDAYRKLNGRGARVRLLPGDPGTVLAGQANNLTGTDLLIIADGQDQESLRRAWFYVPRMLNDRSQVYVESRNAESGLATLSRLSIAEVRKRAAAATGRRAAA
jgi:hypothetical protein